MTYISSQGNQSSISEILVQESSLLWKPMKLLVYGAQLFHVLRLHCGQIALETRNFSFQDLQFPWSERRLSYSACQTFFSLARFPVSFKSLSLWYRAGRLASRFIKMFVKYSSMTTKSRLKDWKKIKQVEIATNQKFLIPFHLSFFHFSLLQVFSYLGRSAKKARKTE